MGARSHGITGWGANAREYKNTPEGNCVYTTAQMAALRVVSPLGKVKGYQQPKENNIDISIS